MLGDPGQRHRSAIMSAMGWTPPEVAAPGWYPAEPGTVRWWDGRRWTEHVARTIPPSRRQSQRRWRTLHRVGIALLVVGVLSMLAGFLSVYGTPALEVWIGVTRKDDSLVVVTAPCTGETLTEVEIQRPGSWEEPGQTLWRVEGAAPLPESLAVGSEPASMRTSVSWDSDAMRESELVVFLNTDRPFTWGGVRYEFKPMDVREGEILMRQGPFSTYEDFVAAAPDDTECEPWEPPRWWIASTMLGFVLLVPVGTVLISLANRPRSQA